MKYLIANDQATLASMGGVSQTLMFPRNAILGIESKTDTTTQLLVQSSNDTDDEDTVTFKHADKSAAATHKVERNIVDEIVSAINSDGKNGFTVLVDLLNGVKLPSAILENTNVTEDGH